MEIYRVSFFGHRRVYQLRSIEERLEPLLLDLFRSKEYVELYIGRNGDFDLCAASMIKRLQKQLEHRDSALILVLPYHVKDEEYYEKYYNEIAFPLNRGTHFKSAITKRNQWMVDHSDLVIAWVEVESGGAYQAIQYAEQKRIPVVNLATLPDPSS